MICDVLSLNLIFHITDIFSNQMVHAYLKQVLMVREQTLGLDLGTQVGRTQSR